jgi:ribosomal protein L37AE/L43A
MRVKTMRDDRHSICARQAGSLSGSKSRERTRKKMKTQEAIPESNIEILVEGKECPNCHFIQLKREGDQIVCPVCGYGHKPGT